MSKWEYLYLEAYRNDVKKINGKSNNLGKDTLPDFLNKLGDEGWELISAFLYSPTIYQSNICDWTCVFKRQKE